MCHQQVITVLFGTLEQNLDQPTVALAVTTVVHVAQEHLPRPRPLIFVPSCRQCVQLAIRTRSDDLVEEAVVTFGKVLVDQKCGGPGRHGAKLFTAARSRQRECTPIQPAPYLPPMDSEPPSYVCPLCEREVPVRQRPSPRAQEPWGTRHRSDLPRLPRHDPYPIRQQAPRAGTQYRRGAASRTSVRQVPSLGLQTFGRTQAQGSSSLWRTAQVIHNH